MWPIHTKRKVQEREREEKVKIIEYRGDRELGHRRSGDIATQLDLLWVEGSQGGPVWFLKGRGDLNADVGTFLLIKVGSEGPKLQTE